MTQTDMTRIAARTAGHYLTWAALFILGVAALMTYPSLAEAGPRGDPSQAAIWLVPFGFVAIMAGAAGAFLNWCLAYPDQTK